MCDEDRYNHAAVVEALWLTLFEPRSLRDASANDIKNAS